MTAVDDRSAAADRLGAYAPVAAVLDDGEVACGAAFLAGPGLALTCAHVVVAAGRRPGDHVRLAFPHLPGAPRMSAWVDDEAWRPVDAEDVAVLRLDEVPDGVPVLTLGSALGCRDRRVWVFGFPHAAPGGRFGYAYAGDLLPAVDGPGELLQLTGANDVTVGFSGAPVIDSGTGLVLGMITAILGVDGYRRGAGVAYATAPSTLCRTHPDLAEVAVCPYRGLAPFTAEDTAWFHGRTEAVRRVTAALDRPAVLLLGPSGSGKSSLLQAGLLPALATGDARPGVPGWQVLTARPGRDLLAELDQAGLPGASSLGLLPAVRDRLATVPAGSRLLLVIDQFEEVFTGPAGRDLLADLSTVIREPSALTVLLAMRDDFYPQLAAAAPELLDALAPGLVNVPATLSREDLRAIIVHPADRVGIGFEPGLVDQIITDLEAVGTDPPERQVPVTVLPLLALALLQLWERRVDGRLTHAGYQRIGRVAGSLTSRCDQGVAALPEEHRPIARRMLTALVRPAEPDRSIPAVRRQVPVDELRDLAADRTEPEPGAVDAVLRALTTAAPLIVTHAVAGRPDAVPVAELVHDALIRDWAALRDWVGADSRFHDWLRRADERQQRWTGTTDAADLLHGSDLAEGLEWEQQRRLPAPTRTFLAASRRAAHARVRRARITALVMAVLLVVGIAAAATAFRQRQNAVAAQRIALSRQLAAQSQIQAPGNPDVSALLAVHAYRVRASREALTSLYAAVSAIRPLRRTLTGHASVVSSVAFTADSATLATASADHTVRLWDVASGTCRAVLAGHPGTVVAVAFSPDGRTLATAGTDRTVRLWDAATGAGRAVLTGHADTVTSLAFSPDGRTLASGGGDSTVRLWNTATGTLRSVLIGHTDAVNAVAFSPDGRAVASGGGDATVRLWNTATGRTTAVLTRHSYAVNAVAYSPDGRVLASASDDHTVRLWNVPSGTGRVTLTGHTDAVNAVAFSPDGRTVATGSSDATVRLWDVATGTSRATLNRHSYTVTAVAFSPDGRTLATGSGDTTVRLWDVAPGRRATTLSGRADVYAVAFSPDGHLLATAHGDNTVRLWDVGTGTRRAVLIGHTDSVVAVAFSRDGTLLATGGTDHTVRLWNVATGTRRAVLAARGDVWSVAFSPDGRTLAAVDGDTTVRLWDVATGTGGATLTGHTDTVNAVAFSPDGRLVATGSSDATVRLWDAATGAHRTVIAGRANVWSVAFSPDGRLLATGNGDNTVRVWDVATATRTATLAGHTDAVNAVAFSPDGRVLASASDDRTARLWDVADATGEATLTGHTDTVSSIAFSPDGRTLATGSGDHTVRLWEFAPPVAAQAVRQICSAVGHELTAEEYALYLPGEPTQPACPGTR